MLGKRCALRKETEAIENQVREQMGRDLPPVGGQPIVVEQRESIGFGLIARAMFQMYPKRTVLGLTLMGSQAFLYNAIFFTYALVLTRFYGIEAGTVPYFLLPFALGNLLGPLLLGRLFDTVGRVPMIAGCYFLTGGLMALTGYLFYADILSAVTQEEAPQHLAPRTLGDRGAPPGPGGSLLYP